MEFEENIEDWLVIAASVIVAMINVFMLTFVGLTKQIPRVKHRLMIGIMLILSLVLAVGIILHYFYFKNASSYDSSEMVLTLTCIWTLSLGSITQLELLHVFSPLAPYWTLTRVRTFQVVEIVLHIGFHFPIYAVSVLAVESPSRIQLMLLRWFRDGISFHLVVFSIFSIFVVIHLGYKIKKYLEDKNNTKYTAQRQKIIRFGFANMILPILDIVVVYIHIGLVDSLKYVALVILCYRIIVLVGVFDQLSVIMLTKEEIPQERKRSILSKVSQHENNAVRESHVRSVHIGDVSSPISEGRRSISIFDPMRSYPTHQKENESQDLSISRDKSVYRSVHFEDPVVPSRQGDHNSMESSKAVHILSKESFSDVNSIVSVNRSILMSDPIPPRYSIGSENSMGTSSIADRRMSALSRENSVTNQNAPRRSSFREAIGNSSNREGRMSIIARDNSLQGHHESQIVDPALSRRKEEESKISIDSKKSFPNPPTERRASIQWRESSFTSHSVQIADQIATKKKETESIESKVVVLTERRQSILMRVASRQSILMKETSITYQHFQFGEPAMPKKPEYDTKVTNDSKFSVADKSAGSLDPEHGGITKPEVNPMDDVAVNNYHNAVPKILNDPKSKITNARPSLFRRESSVTQQQFRIEEAFVTRTNDTKTDM